MKQTLINEIDNGATSVAVLSMDGQVQRENGHTVLPLVRLIEKYPELLEGGFVADRVIGRGVASLLIGVGVASAHGMLMSEGGRKMLEDAGIPCTWAQLTDVILNNRGDGSCPVEALVKDMEDPAVCAAAVRGFADGLRLTPRFR